MAADSQSLQLPRVWSVLAAPFLWLAAVVALVLSLWLGYATYARSADALADRAVSASAELAPLVQQRRIPDAVSRAVADLVARDDLGFNYLTLRNARGVVLVSDGRFEGVAESLPAAQARQLRGLLYRLTSDNRRTGLQRDGATVAHLDFGIAVSAILGNAPMRLGIAFLVFIAAAYTIFATTPAALAAGRRFAANWSQPAASAVRTPKQPPAPRPAAPAQSRGEDQSAVFDRLGVGLMTVDDGGRVRTANQTAGRLLGVDAAGLSGRRPEQAIAFVDRQGQVVDPFSLTGTRHAGGPVRERIWCRASNGYTALDMIAASDDGSSNGGTTMMFWDVDDEPGSRPGIPAHAALSESMLDNSRDAIALVDQSGRLLLGNKAWARSFGIAESELPGASLPAMMPEPFAHMTLARSEGCQGRIPGDGGQQTAAAVDVWPVEWQGDEAYAVIVRPRVEDRTEPASVPPEPTGERQSETGSRAFLMRLEQALSDNDDDGACCTVAVIDVVACRRINRNLGRIAGDTVLEAVYARLAQAAAGGGTVARIGGDEFALMRPGPDSGEDALARVQALVTGALETPVALDEGEIRVETDIGVAVAPGDADTPAALLDCAEAALYAVKTAGDHEPRLYAPEMADAAAQSGDAFYRALLSGEVALRLWPVMHADGALAAAMVEPFWADAEGAGLGGRALLEHAREHDLLGTFGAWAARRLAGDFAGWRDLGLQPVPLILPADAALAASARVAVAWSSVCRHFDLPAHALMLALQSGDASVAVPAGMRRILETDFRDGMPDKPDGLLLTPAVMDDVAHDEEAIATAKSLAAYGRTHDCPVIAGPVTGDEQRRDLEKAGVSLLYGPALGESVAARSFGRQIARRGARPI